MRKPILQTYDHLMLKENKEKRICPTNGTVIHALEEEH